MPKTSRKAIETVQALEAVGFKGSAKGLQAAEEMVQDQLGQSDDQSISRIPLLVISKLLSVMLTVAKVREMC